MVAIAGTWLAVGVPSVRAQRFTSRADAVRVDVLVTDRGRPVAGLAARDFEVRDNGATQAVELVELQKLPLNLIYALDTSGSVSGPLLGHLVAAGRGVLDELRRGDRAALIAFSNRVHLRSPLTEDRSALASALATMTGQGRTTLRDGVFAGLALREADPGRTLLLVFSDGRDTASWLTPAQVHEAAKRTDVVIYAVAVHRVGVEYGPFLRDLAEETGGRVLEADSDRDLRPTFARILAEFRDRYVLTYQPTGVARSGWHRIEVRLKGKRGTVVARRGYYAD